MNPVQQSSLSPCGVDHSLGNLLVYDTEAAALIRAAGKAEGHLTAASAAVLGRPVGPILKDPRWKQSLPPNT